jgi:chromosome segregation ATPase
LAEQAVKEANNAIVDNTKANTNIDKQLNTLRLHIQQFEHEKAELEDELARLDSTTASKLPSLESELKEANDKLANFESALKEAAKERAKCGKTNKNINDEAKNVKENIKVIDKKVADVQEDIREARSSAESFLLNKNTHDAEKRQAESDKQDLIAERDEQDTIVKDFSEQALDGTEQFLGQRIRVQVPSGQTEDTLQVTHDRLEAELKRAQALVGGSAEELKQKELAAKEAWQEVNTRWEDNDQLSRQLKNSLHQRKLRWNRFQAEIGVRAAVAFRNYLGQRAFRGTLNLDHAKKDLSLFVEPDLTEAQSKGRTTKTLSGGEKSFSTICLLLALWEAMGSPIRCLDEFDVFMDSVNRDVSMRMMVSAAREANMRQFILITPQSMSNVDRGKDIKINKMSDPERGQTTITVG